MRSEPSITSPLALPLGEVTERINALQSELAACTRELGVVRANYDRALIEAAHSANEIDELRAEVSTLRRQLTAAQASLDHMMALFKDYRQRYWPG